MRRLTLLLTACICHILYAGARDNYHCRNITMDDGLMSNTVRNIVQDKYGFIWFGTDNGLCRYDGTRVQPYRIAEIGTNQYISALMTSERGIYAGTEQGVFLLPFGRQTFEKLPMDISSTVTSLAVDKESGLWVSTLKQGVWRYTPATGKARHYASAGTIAQVFADNNNQIWTVANGGWPVVQRLNRLHDRFEPVELTADKSYNALRMLQTRDGRLWLGTWENGLMLMHGDGRLEQVLSPATDKTGLHIHTLFQRSEDCICIGCDNGVVCFNPKTREWWPLMPGTATPHAAESTTGRAERFVYSIMGDTEGGLWIGTFYGGVNYISPVGRRFEAFSMESGLTGNVISRFCEDRLGRVWLASDDGGLMCYSPQKQHFVDYPHRNLLARQNVHALSFHDNELWIGTYTSGVMVLNTETGALRQYTRTASPQSLDNSSSYAIHYDRRGNVWVGTMEGLNRYKRATDDFERIGKTNAIIIDIDEDSQGSLWLSTQGCGLWQYSPRSRKFKQYRHHRKNEYSLPDNQVNCALVDEGGHIWVGTLGGLCLFDPKKERFIRIHLDIPSQNVMAIIEDQGALWLSTERGVVKYEPSDELSVIAGEEEETPAGELTGRESTGKNVQRFTLHDGLVSEQFQPNSAIKSSDGRIYFGTTNGFNAFHPYQIKANRVMPPVYITSLEVFNQERRADGGLPLDLSQTREIVFDYDEAKMLSLSFASLSYCSPEKNQYAYMLEGFDRDWNYVDNQHKATYTNLPSGTYTFRVKATNNDGVWSAHEATLRIIVHPPFWWSWYAKTFYLLSIGAAIWFYVRFRLKRADRQYQRELKRVKEEKEKEVREARLNFFTTIAHEIRTPVSLIIGPLEKMMQNGTPTADLRVIDRNAHRLLELVNQLLDFRKVEQQSLVMHFASHSIRELIESISTRFAPAFEQGNKQFTVEYPDERFTAMVDREAVTKVISNLLTNANKYTKDKIRLSCAIELDGEHFRIEVADNGSGIREEDRLRIFAPFFQAQDNKPGTGIGLSIVKNIVDQHHGIITVVSEVGKGSVFTVILPVKQQASLYTGSAISQTFTTADTSQDMPIPANGNKSGTHSHEEPGILAGHDPSPAHQVPVMLIVDDNEDMVSFLCSNFKEQYKVITAGDGIEALHLLGKQEVNIIISDWMMPRMSGTELCQYVRQDLATSHIPFIMLTAKTDNDSKVESMDAGADIYIEKPFSLQYLEACIRNMLEIRHQLMVRFSTLPLEPVTEIADNPTDNAFLQKMNRLIEENFSNSELNVNFLADKLNISRSGLFAKIKTLAELTPNEMIQIVRLKKAAQLLKEKKYHINEICYMVGFSNPSYFSKCFQKQFGITPGAFGSSGDDATA